MIDKRLLSTYDLFDYELTPETIKEQRESNGGRITMRGVLQKADTLNQNGRIYPRAILEREIRNYQKFIAENRALGELDHPDTSVINLKNVSHLVKKTEFQGDVVYGEVEILTTPAGLILQSLIESKVKLGISSRGVGSVKKEGDYHVVQPDFQLICWDFVSEPSTPGAFMLPEGRQLTQTEVSQVLTRDDMVSRTINDILSLRKGS